MLEIKISEADWKWGEVKLIGQLDGLRKPPSAVIGKRHLNY